MKKTAQFIKDTLVGGVLFLLPGALLLWLAEKVLPLARKLMKPVEGLFPGHLVAQFALGTLLAVLALLLVAFIAGMLARTPPGQRLIRSIEESIVGSLPQYRMAKSVLEGRGAVMAYRMCSRCWCPCEYVAAANPASETGVLNRSARPTFHETRETAANTPGQPCRVARSAPEVNTPPGKLHNPQVFESTADRIHDVKADGVAKATFSADDSPHLNM